jgi:hypothetical protein
MADIKLRTDHYKLVMIDKTKFQSLLSMCQCVRRLGLLTITLKRQPQPAPQRAAAYPLHQPRRLQFRSYQPAGVRNHYKIVMFGKINFRGRPEPSRTEDRKLF